MGDEANVVEDFTRGLATMMTSYLTTIEARWREQLVEPLARARSAIAHGGHDPAAAVRELGVLVAAIEQALGIPPTPVQVEGPPPLRVSRRTPLQELRDYPFFPPVIGELTRAPQGTQPHKIGDDRRR